MYGMYKNTMKYIILKYYEIHYSLKLLLSINNYNLIINPIKL